MSMIACACIGTCGGYGCATEEGREYMRGERQAAWIIDQPLPQCCGQEMKFQDVPVEPGRSSLRVFACISRRYHPRIYRNPETGEDLREEDIPWQTK